MSILERAAAQRNETVAQMVIDAIERIGTMDGAAKILGVSKPVLYDWLRDNGYTVVTGRWAKVIPPAQQADATDASEPKYVPLEE